MRKLMGHDKAKGITYQLLLQAKQTRVGDNKFNLLPIEIEVDGEK